MMASSRSPPSVRSATPRRTRPAPARASHDERGSPLRGTARAGGGGSTAESSAAAPGPCRMPRAGTRIGPRARGVRRARRRARGIQIAARDLAHRDVDPLPAREPPVEVDDPAQSRQPIGGERRWSGGRRRRHRLVDGVSFSPPPDRLVGEHGQGRLVERQAVEGLAACHRSLGHGWADQN